MQKTKAIAGFLFTITFVLGGISWFTIYVFTLLFNLPGYLLNVMYTTSIIIPAILMVTMFVGNKYYLKVNSIIYTIFVFWIPKIIYLFGITLILALLYMLGASTSFLMYSTVLMFLITIIFFVYGVWNALNPKVINYEINVPKLKEKWSDKKIVLISDIHLGVVRSEKFMRKIAGMINKLEPDIVFIAGDLIDGPVFPYEQSLSIFGEVKSTYGIFYTAGNHDEYNREQEKYYEALNKYVTVLNDKKVVVNETQIVGVIYAEESNEKTKDRLIRTGFDLNSPSIVMLHDPRNVKALAESNVTLGLSGHTHGGQFFPSTIVVRCIYRSLAKGIHYIKDMAHITSVGVGTAGPLLRIGTTPEIVVIKIK